MSRESDIIKLVRIVSLIDDVFEIVDRHGTVSATLTDKEGQYAILMCISQIGELLSKLESGDLIERLPVRESNAMRNVIVHDYEGVNLRIVTKTLEQDLPSLREMVRSILSAD
jgi:uncharacterized protein with HEPN domain